jgi:hypothetical protein
MLDIMRAIVYDYLKLVNQGVNDMNAAIKNTQPKAKLLGVTGDRSVCECCGKSNLKRVAVIELASGQIVHYGSDCARRELGKVFGREVQGKVDSLVEIQKYIAKWSVKYTPEIVNKGINNKLGYSSEYKDGHYHIVGIGTI